MFFFLFYLSFHYGRVVSLVFALIHGASELRKCDCYLALLVFFKSLEDHHIAGAFFFLFLFYMKFLVCPEA